MKDIEIKSIIQLEKQLVISYSYTEGYEKKNHLGQTMSVSATAGGGQITIDCDSFESATLLNNIFRNNIQRILEGYF